MQKLIEERDRLRSQIDALQNQLLGIERAIVLLEGGTLPSGGQASNKERARNVKDTVLGLLAEAGDVGLSVTRVLEIAQARGVNVERASVSSLLSRLKREGVLDMNDGKYSVQKPVPREPRLVVSVP